MYTHQIYITYNIYINYMYMNRHTYTFFRKRVHSFNQIQKQLRITILKS